MVDLILIIVLGTSVWVFFDARELTRRYKLREGVGGYLPSAWVFFCLLLWLFAFPYYLVKRGSKGEPPDKGYDPLAE